MNAALDIAGFDEHAVAGWMRLELKTPAATLRTFANTAAPPQFLLGVQGEADPALVGRLLTALERIDVSRESASMFARAASVAPFHGLGFVRGPERRLLRGILEDDAVLQVFPVHACELTAEGRLPPLGNFRRWTNVLALDRAPQPWFQFRMRGDPSGLDAPQWSSESWPTFENFVAILSHDNDAWLEVRNRQGRILRFPDERDWDGASARIDLHIGRWRNL